MKGLVLVKLVVSIIGCQLAGYLGSLVTRPAISTWYASLKKPAYSPPDWVFGPVWLTLYLLMGIAIFLVWRQTLARSGVKAALLFFVIQLILNVIWSFLFFGLRSPLLGLADILLLWIAIGLTIIFFDRVSTLAAILLIPYGRWLMSLSPCRKETGDWFFKPAILTPRGFSMNLSPVRTPGYFWRKI